MKIRLLRILKNRKTSDIRGSAMVFALITMSLLILLGVGIVSLSAGTINVNTTDAQNNKAYYASESSINSAIEQVKFEASRYYGNMLSSSGLEYVALYNNFFSGVNNNAQLNFAEPSIDGISTSTTFTTGTFDDTDSICEFLISCTSTAADGSSYVVNGKVYIKLVDVRTLEDNIWITPDAAIKAGGTLILESKNSVHVTNGDIIVSTLSYELKNDLPYVIDGGELSVDPNTASTINDVLVYPSYLNPVLPQVDMLVTENNTTLTWSNIPPAPMYITTLDGVSVHIAACTVPEGIIYVKGDLSINNAEINGDIYCDGNVSISNYCTVNGNIYCRGNMDIINADINGTIYCDGIVSFNNGTIESNIYADGGIDVHNAICGGNLFSTQPITMEVTTVTDGIIYSKSKLTVGTGSTAAIFFSAGDIEFTGDVYVDGTVIAKNDIYFKKDANLDLYVDYIYTTETIDKIINDTNNSFFFTVPGEPNLDEQVFVGQDVTAIGRPN